VRRSLSRPLKVVLYAAFIGLLLASYVAPLQQIFESKAYIAAIRAELERLEKDNAAKRQLTEELETPDGVERTARERYGMIKPGEKVYIVPEEGEEER
jgi:cell division protein FtsB